MSVYDSPSSDEESADEETACDVGEIPSLERETNFLLRRVSRLRRSILFSLEEFLNPEEVFASTTVNFLYFNCYGTMRLPSPFVFLCFC